MNNNGYNEFTEIGKENNIKNYVIVIILYIIVIVLFVFLILGLKNQKDVVKENLKEENQSENIIDIEEETEVEESPVIEQEIGIEENINEVKDEVDNINDYYENELNILDQF